MMLFPLFSLPPTALTLALVVVTAGVLTLILGCGASAALLRRMGWRQMVRRPAQMLIMVAGLALSTMFITAAFGLQDSFQFSSVALRLAQVGNVDEAVTGPLTQAQVAQALARLRHTPDVQATAALYLSVGATIAPASSATASANAYLYAAPPAFDGVYGPLTDAQGQHIRVADLRPGEVLLTQTAARAGMLHAGQRARITWYGLTLTMTVRAVLSSDPAVTTGELAQHIPVAGVIAPLATVQRAFARHFHHALAPNTLCVKNVGPGGMADIGPDGRRSRAVLGVLQSLFGVPPLDLSRNGSTFAPIYFDTLLIHPLKPDVVDDAGGLNPISSKAEFIASPAARQAQWLLPAFTDLMVSAGLLLLVLQCLLLAAERRVELAMSRALGLQRRHLVQALAIEGCGYAAMAAVLGVPLGAAAVALELAVLGRLPALSLGAAAPFQFERLPFHQALRWQSALDAGCLGVLTSIAVVLLTAVWISRGTIVTALRDLDDPPAPHLGLSTLAHTLTKPPRAADGRPIPETPARRSERRWGTLGHLVGALVARGPLCLLLGGILLALAPIVGGDWLEVLGVAVLIAGCAFLVRWGAPLLPAPRELAERLGMTLLGFGWLIYGLQIGQPFFQVIFATDLSALGSHQIGPFSQPRILLNLLLPLAGGVILVMRNADIPAELLTAFLRAARGLAPVSRSSLVYLLTFRLRTGVTVALVSLIAFLIMLLVLNNLGASREQQGVGAYTDTLTAFLTGYLALGLVFGAVAIGVVTSRAVVERRQQIGLLRALGFSPALVRRLFVVEASVAIGLALLIGAALAWWLVAQVARQDAQEMPAPAAAAIVLLLGGYVVAITGAVLPAWQASRVPPAEALRYE